MFDRIGDAIPAWLAWPLSAAGTVLALTGSGLVFTSAALGSVAAIVWAAVAFLVAGLLWYAADHAQANNAPGTF